MRILVACVGNIFFGDDAFGVEVARELSQRPLPAEVSVVDFGIRGLDLTYALLDDYFAVILVDTVARGGPPGTLYVLEPVSQKSDGPASEVLLEAHGMDPARVLQLAAALGGKVARLLVVGCEPADCGDGETMCDGLSDPVRAAVPEAFALVVSLARRLLTGETIDSTGDMITSLQEDEQCGARQPTT